MADYEKDEIDVPFPQANDFEKVIKLIKIEKENLLQDNDYLIKLLNVTQRQVNYYLAACVFLGVINKERLFTEYGCSLRQKGYEQFISNIARKIISLPVFGDVFFSQFLFNKEISNDEIAELLCITYEINNFEVAKRRASTVRKWIDWIYVEKTHL